MNKILNFGKIDYNRNGRRAYPVTVEVSLKDGNLSICGSIWNTKKTDVKSGGQNLDTIREYLTNDVRFNRVYNVWQRWHLNDLKSGCEHQRAEGWGEKEVVLRKYSFPYQVIQTLERAASKDPNSWTKQVLAKLKKYNISAFSFTYLSDEQLADLKETPMFSSISQYLLVREEKKCTGQLYPSEHPEGVLCKPCPVCGYKYGTKWLKEELPKEVVKEIEAW